MFRDVAPHIGSMIRFQQLLKLGNKRPETSALMQGSQPMLERLILQLK